MSPVRTRTRLWLALTLLAVAALISSMGRIAAHESPLQKADAIYVLGGSWAERWLEAADLYREGYAPAIVISRGTVGPGEDQLEKRGIHVPGPAELGRTAMVESLKIPSAAVEILSASVDNTAQEAEAIQALVQARHWRRLIVITDRPSTRRAEFAMRRILGPDVEIIMRASRHDPFTPGIWWSSRQNFRAMFYEAPKLLAYWIGMRG
ncbi:MAG: YdcF family protein [Acidobacteria bacterium]|nr:YdcF family protein [Acidobacteriota bacterium]